MARGGRRAGTKGAVYTNRSDLRSGPLPLAAPRGLPYGDRAKLIAAQRAVPMGPPPSAAPGPAAPSTPPGAPAPEPGSLPFTHPTQRPNEPVTAGLPMGPGPGPEAITGVGAGGFGHSATADMLSQLAAVPGAGSDLKALASYAQQGRG